MPYGVIYLIRNRINGKEYVGQTVQRLLDRIHDHCCRRSQMPISRAIRKYGLTSFEWIILEECEDETSLNAAEKRWIAERGSLAPNGYNLTTGGWSTGRQHPDVVARRAAANRGKRRTAEAKARISAKLKGRRILWGLKISASRKNVKLSVRQLENLAVGRGKRWDHPDAKALQSRNGSKRKIPIELEPEVVALRKRGWTQAQLAAHFGIGQSAISKLLRRQQS